MKIRFKSACSPSFYATVRLEVDKYFLENNISKHGNLQMAFKIFGILGLFVLLYAIITFSGVSLGTKLLLVIPFGMVTALIGLNICHDAIHGALSKNRNINKAFSILFNIISANAYVWHITHNIVHHTYTNIKGTDEDLEIAPGLIRIHPTDEWKPIQKYQHYYAFFLYGLASLSWIFRKDFVKFFKKKIGNYDNSKPPKREVFNLIFYKAVYASLFIAMPFIVLEISVLQFLTGFVLMHLVKGWTLALVFHPAHAVCNTEFPEPNEKGNIEDEWAAFQMRTTSNFATDSKLVAWLTGGLNMQVEHHLFPNICHIHYPKIALIVKKLAKEHNLPYLENKTFLKALKAHYLLLKKYSINEQAQEKGIVLEV
jgi:linoleoyl-CoA desaturase